MFDLAESFENFTFKEDPAQKLNFLREVLMFLSFLIFIILVVCLYIEYS